MNSHLQSQPLASLELFLGEATPQSARVYARLPVGTAPQSSQLSGQMSGPKSMYARTLPARSPFRPLRSTDGAVWAQTVVVDPCFWTPESPNLYECHIELRMAGSALDESTRVFGMRRLAAAGRDFIFDGKRFVLRGISQAAAPSDLSPWRQTDTALVSTTLDESLAERASRQGLLLVADWSIDATRNADRQLSRLARWPAIGFVVLPAQYEWTFAQPANLLVGRCVDTANQEPPPGTDFIVWTVPEAGELDEYRAIVSRFTGPIVARAPLPGELPLEESRRRCDRLQARLAATGGLAGYCV